MERDASFKSTDKVRVEDVGSDDKWSVVSDKKAHGTLKIEEEKDLYISSTEPLSPVLFASWNEGRIRYCFAYDLQPPSIWYHTSIHVTRSQQSCYLYYNKVFL